MIDAWSDCLCWSIRPDCRGEARSMMERLTEAGRGLHRDNVSRDINRMWARYLDVDELPIDTEGNVAIVSVVGPLVNNWNPWTANYPALTAAFEHLKDQSGIGAVMVRFKTPGGTVSGLHECAMALDALAETKLTVAQVDGGCYSAGYYLASYCGSIACGPTDHVGNIGIVSSLYDYSEMFREAGVRPVTKRSGVIKGIGIPGEPITGIQEQLLEEMNARHFEHFKSAVMTGREMTEEQFAAVSDGSWWLGEQAIELNIIDRVSSYKETLAAIRKQAA